MPRTWRPERPIDWIAQLGDDVVVSIVQELLRLDSDVGGETAVAGARKTVNSVGRWRGRAPGLRG